MVAVKVPRESVTFSTATGSAVPHTATNMKSHQNNVKHRDDGYSTDNYVSFLIEQISRQNDLREKELAQAKEVRVRELEFEERKWERHIALLEKQQEAVLKMLLQQDEQQKMIIDLFKQLHQESSSGKSE